MDFLLNERSLHGQFENGKVFLESLGPVMECIKIIHAQKDARIPITVLALHICSPIYLS